MDYVWIRLDQKGPDNNLCAKRVCLGKSVTLHLVAAVTLHLGSSNLDGFVMYYICDFEFYHLYVRVLVHGHSGKCEFAMSNFCDLGMLVIS